MNQRAIVYRSLHDIPAAWGTAVNVQVASAYGDCATRSLHPRPVDRRQ